jgi:hypothetical protein
MGQIFASCGHEVMELDDLIDMYQHTDDGILFGSYCLECSEQMKENAIENDDIIKFFGSGQPNL